MVRYLKILLTLSGGKGAKKWDLDKKWMVSQVHLLSRHRDENPAHADRSPHAPWLADSAALHDRSRILSPVVHFLLSPLSLMLLPSQWFSVAAELSPMGHNGHFCGWRVVTMMGSTLELRCPTSCAMKTFPIFHMTFTCSSRFMLVKNLHLKPVYNISTKTLTHFYREIKTSFWTNVPGRQMYLPNKLRKDYVNNLFCSGAFPRLVYHCRKIQSPLVMLLVVFESLT